MVHRLNAPPVASRLGASPVVHRLNAAVYGDPGLGAARGHWLNASPAGTG